MNRLSFQAVLAALALAWSAVAVGQTAPPSIYGVVDLSAGRYHRAGSSSSYASGSGLTPSYLGIRGSDDLGGGLRARFGLEAYVSTDTGSVGRAPGGAFWGRTAYIGLQGSFGTTLLGRLPTPLWISTRLFNPFGESEAFSPTMRQYFGQAVIGDSRWDNSVGYTSPEPEGGNGFSYNIQYNASEQAPGATGKNLGANVLYTSGPLSATVAWQRVRNGPPPFPAGFDHQSVYHAGASYEFDVVRLYGQVGRVRTEATTAQRTTLYQVGAVAPIAAGFLMASVGQSKEHGSLDTTRTTYAMGYDYFLSKTTDVYAVAMHDQASRVKSANTVAAGLRLRF